MKKYFKPNIYTGTVAFYFLSIGLETWAEYLKPENIQWEKPQMVLAAKIFHAYFLKQRFSGLFS